MAVSDFANRSSAYARHVRVTNKEELENRRKELQEKLARVEKMLDLLEKTPEIEEFLDLNK